jgi:SAM-dependent methyltransferase
MNLRTIKDWLLTRIANMNFRGSAAYWEQRYASGGNSGAGSYDKLATFKARIINSFIKAHQVQSVIEFGCGDGNQLSLGVYPRYIGLDIAKASIRLCADRFRNDPDKSFFLYDSTAFVDPLRIFQTDLAMSLDVIYHIIEEDVFSSYMSHLFRASNQFLIVYSTNFDSKQTFHVKHRNFTKWIDQNIQGWKLIETIKNEHPRKSDDEYTSAADFFIYQKITS